VFRLAISFLLIVVFVNGELSLVRMALILSGSSSFVLMLSLAFTCAFAQKDMVQHIAVKNFFIVQ
jgi:hypothetical protein